MTNPTTKNGDHPDEGGVHKKRVAVLTITMDMETGLVDVGGSAPTFEFAKAMCQMAADQLERKITARQAAQALTVAGPGLLHSLKTGH